MKRLLIIIALAALASFGLSAGTVTFSTTGSELCVGADGCSLTSITFGQTMLTYTPVTTTGVIAPSNVNLGYITASCVGGGTGCDMSQLPTGLALYLNVTQTVPASGSGAIEAGTLVGSISGTGSSADIDWTGIPSTSIATGSTTTTYSLISNFLAIVPPSTNNCQSCVLLPSGSTTIEGTVTQITATPEPASIFLLSTGLVGFVLARRRMVG